MRREPMTLPRRAWRAVRSGATVPAMLAYNAGLWLVLPDRRPYVAPDGFAFLDAFEQNWEKVRAELDDLLASGPAIPAFEDVEPDQGRIWRAVSRITGRIAPAETASRTMDPSSWKTFVFRTYGRDVASNRQRCPETSALLDSVPGLVGAMFSVLDPGVRLPSHFGLYMGALRVHLGLSIPPGGETAMRVGGQTREWEEGKVLVFEHSRWHTAWNHSDTPRVVLIFDFERPMPWLWLERLNHRIVVSWREAERTQEAVAHIERLGRDPVEGARAGSPRTAAAGP